MAYRIISFLCKKSSLTTAEFISYYETKHMPLIISMSGETLPTTYKRRYTHRDETHQPDVTGSFGIRLIPQDGGPGVQYDVITELVFATKEASDAWCMRVGLGENGERIRKDEEVFVDRSRTTAFIVEEYVTRDEKQFVG